MDPASCSPHPSPPSSPPFPPQPQHSHHSPEDSEDEGVNNETRDSFSVLSDEIVLNIMQFLGFSHCAHERGCFSNVLSRVNHRFQRLVGESCAWQCCDVRWFHDTASSFCLSNATCGFCYSQIHFSRTNRRHDGKVIIYIGDRSSCLEVSHIMGLVKRVGSSRIRHLRVDERVVYCHPGGRVVLETLQFLSALGVLELWNPDNVALWVRADSLKRSQYLPANFHRPSLFDVVSYLAPLKTLKYLRMDNLRSVRMAPSVSSPTPVATLKNQIASMNAVSKAMESSKPSSQKPKSPGLFKKVSAFLRRKSPGIRTDPPTSLPPPPPSLVKHLNRASTTSRSSPLYEDPHFLALTIEEYRKSRSYEGLFVPPGPPLLNDLSFFSQYRFSQLTCLSLVHVMVAEEAECGLFLLVQWLFTNPIIVGIRLELCGQGSCFGKFFWWYGLDWNTPKLVSLHVKRLALTPFRPPCFPSLQLVSVRRALISPVLKTALCDPRLIQTYRMFSLDDNNLLVQEAGATKRSSGEDFVMVDPESETYPYVAAKHFALRLQRAETPRSNGDDSDDSYDNLVYSVCFNGLLRTFWTRHLSSRVVVAAARLNSSTLRTLVFEKIHFSDSMLATLAQLSAPNLHELGFLNCVASSILLQSMPTIVRSSPDLYRLDLFGFAKNTLNPLENWLPNAHLFCCSYSTFAHAWYRNMNAHRVSVLGYPMLENFEEALRLKRHLETCTDLEGEELPSQ